MGTWHLLVADTVRRAGAATASQPDSVSWKPATFRITDTLISRSRKEVRAALTPGFSDLANLAGGSWAVNGPLPVLLGGTAIALNYRKPEWEIDLSPTMFDVGLSLIGQLRGDSLVGTWSEYVMGTPARGGKFVMHRAAFSQ